jgi:hypothetical protein
MTANAMAWNYGAPDVKRETRAQGDSDAVPDLLQG